MKKQQNENQLDFLDFMPTTHDPAFELEVYAGTGKRVAPDDHPILMAWRDAYMQAWCEDYPDGECARMREMNREGWE